MKYGLYLHEVLMAKFETEREAYKAADFANSETGITHHVKLLNDSSKWNELKMFIEEGILSTEAGMLNEQEKALRIVMDKIIELESK